MLNSLIENYSSIGIAYKTSEPMSEHTTFRIGGEADVFACPDSVEQLIDAIKIAKNEGVKFIVVGRGSNLLFSDDGFRGVVISTENLKKISVEGNRIICECGVTMTVLAQKARDAELQGLSFAYGIPGFVGGAVYMNAGAYGGQMSDVMVKSTYYNTETDEICIVEGDGHKFGYRESIYKENPNYVILSAEMELTNGKYDEIKAEMEDFMERRRSKQPLEYPSAGSVFKRCEGYFTGKLIEESGLKGKRVGGAEVSVKHAGFIINVGGAKASDVLQLVQIIKDEIRKNYSLELVCEIIYVS